MKLCEPREDQGFLAWSPNHTDRSLTLREGVLRGVSEGFEAVVKGSCLAFKVRGERGAL
jgi:hypothetical protein